jgi:hypothetical protein
VSFDLKKLNDVKIKEKYKDERDRMGAWENVRQLK